ncbi:uncharacterized protein LOC126687683 isoform X1 [Mercurialis annua]|uniref:uncharacterized protein LOC126687683 isoform X1 n=1 Tax=Mercurialis annua TaxID=3986 RepID=UPI00215F3B4B|nr:uncharacterized protein LOC126687683 isoform X1 [Mercurialis annua]
MQLSYEMDKEERNQRANKALEPDILLQWGNRKRLRCVRVRDPRIISQRSDGVFRRKITTRTDRRVSSVADEKITHHFHSNHRLTRNSEASILRSSVTENRKSASPEKEDRYYTTRGSVVGVDENGKISMDLNNGEENNSCNNNNKGNFVWPKLYISLSSKEKEEDFMAMKGCKLPQRPKKRAKIIQRSLLLVSPGAWLTDMCQERYEVREKKSSKKQRPRGLKAMGSMESDSE